MQWRIQDFPWGHGPHGWGIDSRGGYVLDILYVKMKESGPFGAGGVLGIPLDLPMPQYTPIYILVTTY